MCWFAGLFATCLQTSIIWLLGVQISTPAQSKIEFTAHLIKISSQITAKILVIFANGILVLYFKSTALLVITHILRIQKWAWGHRCSLRHNVCRHATDALANEYNRKTICMGNICWWNFWLEILLVQSCW